MIGLNHTLTGAVLGLSLQQPLLVAPLALASHFVLDILPHFDHEAYRYGSRWFWLIMVSDGIASVFALTMVLLVSPQFAAPILTGAGFAVLPDLSLAYYYTRRRPQYWFFKYHLQIQWFERPAGALVEGAYLVFISTVLVTILLGSL